MLFRQHEAIPPADDDGRMIEARTILFAVRGVGEDIDVVRMLVSANDESISMAVLGEPDRLVFDSIELRTALSTPYEEPAQAA
jgi:hypothetical protein